jgi:aspartyl/asparaginyl beta-hydroxylase (cupin superfamily)
VLAQRTTLAASNSTYRWPDFRVLGHHPELGRGLLTFHLGVDVAPGKSFLFVDGIPSEEANAKSVVFDGSFEHFAVNMSSSDRTILYMEFDSTEAKLI